MHLHLALWLWQWLQLEHSISSILNGFTAAMDLPTPREVELETLLRQRDAQVIELSVSFQLS